MTPIRSLLMLAMLFVTAAPAVAAQGRLLLQLVDYIGVDYPPTIEDGKVVDEFEYKEMQQI